MKAAAWVAVGLVAAYHLNGRPQAETDCVPAPYAAWSLVRHGSLDLAPYPDLAAQLGGSVRETAGGAVVSRYPYGSAMAMAPFVAPAAAARAEPLSAGWMKKLGKFAAACYVAAAAGLFYLVCRAVAPAGRWPATVLFGLGTCLYSVASQAIWMHGPAVFWACLALWRLTRPGDLSAAGGAVAGLALGLATVTRPTAGLFALATGAALLAQGRWRAALAAGAGGAVPVAVLFFINWHQFGNPFLGGYAAEYDLPGPPLWLGLSGQLVAPSRGVFVYSPALLLAPVGAVIVWRRRAEFAGRRGVILAWLGAAAATVLYYARWHDWRGGWCFGPRFLCESMPVMCLLVAVAYGALTKTRLRAAAWGLVGLSVAVHVIGVFGHDAHRDWQIRSYAPDDHGLCLFQLRDTQIEAHARSLGAKVSGRPAAGGK